MTALGKGGPWPLHASVALLLAACSSLTGVPENHIIMVDTHGMLVCPAGNAGEGHHTTLWPYPTLDPDRSASHLPVSAAHVDDVVTHLMDSTRGQRARRVMISIHGGMVTQVESVRRATDLVRALSADTNPDADVHPVVVNWQSSFFTSWINHATSIRRGEERPFWGPVSLPLQLLVDLGGALVRAPEEWSVQLYGEVASGLYECASEHIAAVRCDALGHAPGSYDIRVGADARSTTERAADAVPSYLFMPTRLSFTPLLDGFGTGAWDAMLMRVERLFDRHADYRSQTTSNRPTGGLSLFMDRLMQEVRKTPPDERWDSWDITLVGHSMGCLAVHELLRRYTGLPVRRVVLMASAAPVQAYESVLLPYLQRHDRAHVYHLVLHDIAERREIFSPFVDMVLPRGSLLSWIDNVLTQPTSLYERRMGQFVNLMAHSYVVPEGLRNRIHIKQFDYSKKLAGRQPQKHGEFDDFTFWRSDFLEPQGGPDYTTIDALLAADGT